MVPLVCVFICPRIRPGPPMRSQRPCKSCGVPYSDATTIKDALQAGATPSDMRNDFEKGLMVIENFQTPEPVRGSGNMRHMASLRFTFHKVNCRFRECASSYARALVRGLPCGHKDRAKVADYLRNCDSSELSRRLLRFTKSTPNSPLTVAGRISA